eukprot:UN09610
MMITALLVYITYYRKGIFKKKSDVVVVAVVISCLFVVKKSCFVKLKLKKV